MKAYGSNRLLVVPGMMLSYGVFSGWLRWVTDHFFHRVRAETLEDIAEWATTRTVGVIVCLFLWACWQRAKKPAAPQPAPIPMTPEEAVERAKYAPHFGARWRRQALLGVFGITSAVAGTVTLAAHLWHGVPVVPVVFCTLVIPASVAVGVWLINAALLLRTKG